jgi:hypothetical protein
MTVKANKAAIRNIISELPRGFPQTSLLEIDFVDIFAILILIETSSLVNL